MALAATFAAQGMRPASFLPAIKCSSCGEEIEIAAMGDHICSKAPPSPLSQPASLTNAFTIRQMNAHGHMPHAPSPLQQQQQQQNKPVSLPKTRVRAPTVTSHHLPAPKAIRPPPPRINPEAANTPFLSPRPPRSDSPLSPALSVRSGSSQGSRPPPPLRSMTSPMPRVFDPRPPSPEMSGNLDCAFPPFMPASGGGGSRPGTSSGRKMSAGSERGGSRGREGQDGGKDHWLDLHKTPSEPHTRQRDPRPALGAFTKSEGSQIPHVASRQPSQGRNARGTDHRPQDVPPVPRPVQQHRQEKSHTPSGSGSSVASSAPSLGNSNSSSGRSPVTSSAASSVDALSLLTTEPRHYGDEAGMRVPGLNFNPQKPGMRAELPASRSPPRSFTRPAPPKDIIAPPRSPTLPAIISPPLESPMDPALQGRQIPGRSATEPWRPSAAPGPARPTMSRTNTMPEARVMEPVEVLLPPVPTLSVPEPSDKDYDPYRPTSPAPATRSRSKSNAAPAQFKAYTPPPLPPPPSQTLAPTHPPSTSPTTTTTHPPPPPPHHNHEPTCRGCRHPIAGKSVKAADGGRLTGRWHKPCFRCVTCAQPFTTADFYVWGNEPYCEQHYHEANGSLCEGCGGGIEGGYLGTCCSSSSTSGDGGGVVVDRKFHPGCFRCCECRVVLAEDYFEIWGRVFCERDALAAMRGLAGKKTEALAGSGAGLGKGKGVGVGGEGLSVPDRKALTAERRTTRLMMM
ncbi:hypothetical protein B0A54_14016 [Friedmanniomyces endolithicus]|uniref:LIM zinc-binding domain-containing protein n=1 Tax=Friedmanniomyces endolithicus TaxID=329885 RepID=A0A4U0UGS6_9PEZI|nr:hypothetical protein B0A54_14016 [Friedmanniomyces endolithicus]